MRFPQWLIKLSCRINALFCGNPKQSLCARIYESRLNGNVFALYCVDAIDLMFWFDKNHCYNAWRLWKINQRKRNDYDN